MRQAIIALAIAVIAGRVHAQFAPGILQDWKDAAKPRTPSSMCADLRSLGGYDFSIDTASLMAARGDVPEFCLVRGQIQPEVRFEVALPREWNGRVYMFGNGGFAGESLDAPGRVATRNGVVRRGFASVQTNTGHDAAREPGASFAANSQKLIDYAYRAVHLTAVTAKSVARAYYDTAPARSYFVGCSTGGRQGLIAAQRFPDDFDGIVAGAPVLDFTGTMTHYVAMNRALAAAPIASDRLRLVGEKIYEKCDAADGLQDGLIDDPRQCRFDLTRDVPACDGTTDACVTPAQAKALQSVYGAVTAKGMTIAPGLPYGSEVLMPGPVGRRSGWHPWIISEGQLPLTQQFAESFFRDMATPGTPIDWRQFDPERDFEKLSSIGALLNATDPDLSRFRARGGKLLMYFGWSDPALNPMMGVNYYTRVRERMGERTSEFARLFMMPGVLHCSGGIGPSSIDPLTPLAAWVERGAAPDVLIAAQQQAGKTTRTRPLCPYPMVAKYNGTGSHDEAASFSCVAPPARSTQ